MNTKQISVAAQSILLLLIALFLVSSGRAQQTIALDPGATRGSENGNGQEKEYFTHRWNERVVYNVVHPTLTVFRPDSAASNGTAVIICPGGGFRILAIDVEGKDVATWLTKRGYTCFILKYRLVHMTSEDPVKEISDGIEAIKFKKENDSLIPLAVTDAATALTYIRTHAAEFHVSKNKIGMIGFSAGGILGGSLAFTIDSSIRPNFVGCIYSPVPDLYQSSKAPKAAPPLFLTAASNDEFHLVPGILSFYTKWQQAGIPVELHLYESGGHGFGMKIQHLTTDGWIDRFFEWLKQEGF